MSAHQEWSARRHMALGLIASLVLVGGFGGWAVTATLSGAVIASGQVEVEQNRQIIQHPDGGVVAEILVTEGARVLAGEPLLRLDGALLLSQLAIVESQYFEALARHGRLGAERDGLEAPVFLPEFLEAIETRAHARDQADGQIRLFEARARTLAQQLEQLERRREQTRAQAQGFVAQRAGVEAEMALLAEELVAQESLLEQGLTQAARVNTLRREQARLQGSLGTIMAEEAQVQDRIAEIGLQILTAESQRREEAEGEMRTTGGQILELAERRRALLEMIDRLELRAPVAGVVYALAITTPRAVLRAADPVMQIVPQDRPLVLSVQIPPTDIDQVYVGQSASVMFSGLSMRDTPDLSGTVTRLSADAFVDERMGFSYFRGEVALTEESRALLGERAILPGMPVDVFMRTSERTPLDYLTRPLTDYFMRAFREH
jgi:HlyD family secretion protein